MGDVLFQGFKDTAHKDDDKVTSASLRLGAGPKNLAIKLKDPKTVETILTTRVMKEIHAYLCHPKNLSDVSAARTPQLKFNAAASMKAALPRLFEARDIGGGTMYTPLDESSTVDDIGRQHEEAVQKKATAQVEKA
jgi:hypothetical protein